jgi:hypothetical protein
MQYAFFDSQISQATLNQGPRNLESEDDLIQ